MICGWCGHPTKADPCSACGHADPGQPWAQRGMTPPVVDGALDPGTVRRRLVAARQAVEATGRRATVEALAEELNVSTRTVRRWREMSA